MRRKKKKKKREEKGRRKQEKRRPPIPSDSITQTRKCIHAATLTKIPKRVEVEVLSMFLLFFFSHEKIGRFLFKRLPFVFHFFSRKKLSKRDSSLSVQNDKKKGGIPHQRTSRYKTEILGWGMFFGGKAARHSKENRVSNDRSDPRGKIQK